MVFPVAVTKLIKLLRPLALVFILTFLKADVFAISQFWPPAETVLGQPNTGESVLSTPIDVTFAGNKLIAPSINGRYVYVYNSIPTVSGTGPDVKLTTVSETGSLFGLVYGISSNGTKLAVADFSNNRVLIYNHIPDSDNDLPDVVVGQPNLDSVSVNQGGSPGPNTLYAPSGVFLGEGKLIIADRYNNRVLIYNSIPTSNNASADIVLGQEDFVINGSNSGGRSASSMAQPFSVQYLHGKLLLAERANHRILIWNSLPTENHTPADLVLGQPNFTSGTANNGGIGAATMDNPGGVYYDGTKVFVGDYFNNRVLIWNSFPTQNFAEADVVLGQPDFTTKTSNYGGLSATSIASTHGVKVYRGSLYLADYANSRIKKYNVIPTTNNAAADTVIGQPSFESYVGAAYYGGINNSSMKNPNHVFGNGNNLLVAESASNRVLLFNQVPTTNMESANVVIGQPDFETVTGNTGGISAKTLDGIGGGVIYEGKVIISDPDNNRVLIYNSIPTENFAEADLVLGQPDFTSKITNNGGISARSLNSPQGVVVYQNHLIVSDRGNKRVLIWNSFPTENFAEADVVIGQPDFVSNTVNNGGVSAKSINDLYGPNLAVYNGKLLISDLGNMRVLIFNEIPTENFAEADGVIGQPDLTSNTANNGGRSSRSLNSPCCVYTDEEGRLFICDRSNYRILGFSTIPESNFDEADTVFGQPDFISASPNNGGISSHSLTSNNYTHSVYTAGTKIIIADDSNHRVLIYPTGPQNVSIDYLGAIKQHSLELTLAADDAKEYKISSDSSFSGVDWDDFSTSVSYTFPDSETQGYKNLFLKLRDYLNYETNYDLETALDKSKATKPKISLASKENMSNLGDSLLHYAQNKLKIYLDTKDRITSTHWIMVSQDKNFKGATWKVYDGDINLRFDHDGKKNLYFKFKDEAGNVSDTYKQQLNIDTINPELNIFKIGTFTPDFNRFSSYYYTEKNPIVYGSTEENAELVLSVDGNEASRIDEVDREHGFNCEDMDGPDRCQFELEVDALTYGTHEVVISATDPANNRTEIKFRLIINQDTSAFPESLANF